MKAKQKKPAQSANVIEKNNSVSPPQSTNKALLWILGGCLLLVVIFGIVIGGMIFWGYKKAKKEIKENKQKFEQAQKQAENIGAERAGGGMPSQISIPEEPMAAQNEENGGIPDDIYPPEVSEKAIGYLKKVYTKNGKNYISIDYIQWFSGDAAEKAMREDGECPKRGECIVLNDYYIRNQNPLIRTFEVTKDAEILAHDFSADYASGSWNEKWTFSRFSQYYNKSANNGYWDYAPFHVEIGNNEVVSLKEQYIP